MNKLTDEDLLIFFSSIAGIEIWLERWKEPETPCFTCGTKPESMKKLITVLKKLNLN